MSGFFLVTFVPQRTHNPPSRRFLYRSADLSVPEDLYLLTCSL